MRHLPAILFPFDFSPAGLAMPYVGTMAQGFSAPVTVCMLSIWSPSMIWDRVLRRRAYPLAHRSRTLQNSKNLGTSANGSSKSYEEFAKNRFADVNHATKIEDGDPAAVIECVAQRENVDLIMMPTNGPGKFRRMLVGSVTAKVLHDVDYPIFTTAHESAPTSTPVTSYRYRLRRANGSAYLKVGAQTYRGGCDFPATLLPVLPASLPSVHAALWAFAPESSGERRGQPSWHRGCQLQQRSKPRKFSAVQTETRESWQECGRQT